MCRSSIVAVALLVLHGPLETSAAALWTRVAPHGKEVFARHGEVLMPSNELMVEDREQQHNVSQAEAHLPQRPRQRVQLLQNIFDTENLKLGAAYIAMTAFTIIAAVFMYWSKGMRVILCILVYMFALSTIKLAVKWVYEEYDFNYPKFVTAGHFIFSALIAACILHYQGDREKSAMEILAKGVPTQREFWLQIFPIALAFAYSVGAGNEALVYTSAAFTEIIAATAPVTSALFVVMMGMPFDYRLAAPTVFVVVCVCISTSGEVNFSMLGLVLCILAMVTRALKATLQQYLMQGETKQKFNPVTLLLWMCLPSFVLIIVWSAVAEGAGPYQDLAKMEGSRRLGVIIAIGVSCFNACILNLSNLIVTRDLGAVGVQLAAQVKSILTFLGSMALFGDPVTMREVLGFAGVLLGVFWFTRTEMVVKKEKEDEKKAKGEGKDGSANTTEAIKEQAAATTPPPERSVAWSASLLSWARGPAAPAAVENANEA